MIYFFLAALVFIAWGFERYFKLFSRLAKGVNTTYVSAALLGVFLIFVIVEFVNGNWFRSVALIVLAVIVYVSFKQPESNESE